MHSKDQPATGNNQSPETGKELAKTQQTSVANNLMGIGGGGRALMSSLDMGNVNGRKMLMKTLQDCDAKLTEQVNICINATDYVAHEVELTSKEDGQIIQAVRLVIVDDKGLTYECVSATLLRSLQTVAFVYGPPPWNPPRKLTVRSRRNGERNIYWFDAE